MAGRLTVQERAQIAARYEAWGCIVQLQRWWRTIKGNDIKKNYTFIYLGVGLIIILRIHPTSSSCMKAEGSNYNRKIGFLSN